MTQETEDVVGRMKAIMGRCGQPDCDVCAAMRDASDRIDVLARECDHWKAECKALCDVVSEHTKARAALHQEGVPDAKSWKYYPEDRPCPRCTDGTWDHAERLLAARSQNTPDSAKGRE